MQMPTSNFSQQNISWKREGCAFSYSFLLRQDGHSVDYSAADDKPCGKTITIDYVIFGRASDRF